ncbi:MAG: winged helix-turn-helix domain-containing protein, partial [Fibrobacter sp.]|nr:winged helix-turn-helix domain-containing protein [Fibrobacter sp.]
RQKILYEIRKDSFTTLNQLVERTGLSRNGVRYVIDRLKADGILERTGSTKKGQWLIKSTNN